MFEVAGETVQALGHHHVDVTGARLLGKALELGPLAGAPERAWSAKVPITVQPSHSARMRHNRTWSSIAEANHASAGWARMAITLASVTRC